ADRLQVARVVHQHVGRQLRRLVDENAATRASRAKEICGALVFGAKSLRRRIVVDRDRAGAAGEVDATGRSRLCEIDCTDPVPVLSARSTRFPPARFAIGTPALMLMSW